MPELHQPQHPVRLVTASSLFDGHDASINIMRRILQTQGCEVIHLGHNRSVQEVVDAALEEDVQGVAVSSYQGGHVEYFEYLVESLRAARRRPRQGRRRRRRRHRARRDRAAARVRRDDLLPRGRPAARPGRDDQPGRRATATSTCGRRARPTSTPCSPATGSPSRGRSPAPRPGSCPTSCSTRIRAGGRPRARRPVLGITGTGGSGKSSAHRRAGPPAPRRPAGQAARRRGRRRPDPAQGRRRAARRPDPDELPRRRPGLLPLARHPRRPTSCPSTSPT